MGRFKDGASEAARRIEDAHEEHVQFFRRWRKRAEQHARAVGRRPSQQGWFHMPERRSPDDSP